MAQSSEIKHEIDELLAAALDESRNYPVFTPGFNGRKFRSTNPLMNLVCSGYDIHQFKDDQSILIQAILKGDIDTNYKYGIEKILIELIKAGADVNVHVPTGETLLNWAIRQYFTDLIKVILDVNVDLDMRSSDGKTALVCLVEKIIKINAGSYSYSDVRVPDTESSIIGSIIARTKNFSLETHQYKEEAINIMRQLVLIRQLRSLIAKYHPAFYTYYRENADPSLPIISSDIYQYSLTEDRFCSPYYIPIHLTLDSIPLPYLQAIANLWELTFLKNNDNPLLHRRSMNLPIEDVFGSSQPHGLYDITPWKGASEILLEQFGNILFKNLNKMGIFPELHGYQLNDFVRNFAGGRLLIDFNQALIQRLQKQFLFQRNESFLQPYLNAARMFHISDSLKGIFAYPLLDLIGRYLHGGIAILSYNQDAYIKRCEAFTALLQPQLRLMQADEMTPKELPIEMRCSVLNSALEPDEMAVRTSGPGVVAMDLSNDGGEYHLTDKGFQVSKAEIRQLAFLPNNFYPHVRGFIEDPKSIYSNNAMERIQILLSLFRLRYITKMPEMQKSLAPDQRSVQFIKYANREQPPLIYSSIRKTSIKIKPATFALQDISDEMFRFSEMSKDDKATPEHLAAKLEDIEEILKNNAGCLDLQNEGSDCLRNLINTVQGELLQKALVELLDRYSSSKRQRLE